MNAARRKLIARAIELIEQAQEHVTEAANGELEAFYNLPEALQGSERGQDLEANAERLDEVIGNLETALDELREFVPEQVPA